MNKRALVIGMALSLAGLAACASMKDFFRNVTAADCASPAAEQAFVMNMPGVGLVPPSQLVHAVDQVCIGLYGTVAAPTPAPGNNPVFPAATPTPSPVASPVPSPVASPSK